jgi:hypothetical protein
MKLPSSRRPLAGVTAAACVAILAATAAHAGAGLVPHKAISLPNGQHVTSFDISFVDPISHTYVLGDRTSKAVDVIDTSTNTIRMQAGQGLFVGFTGNNSTSGPDGVMIVNSTVDSNGNVTGGEIWAGDGNSTLKVLSLKDGSLIANVSTGGTTRVDEMCFDPIDNVGMAANNAETPPYATLFNGTTHAIIAQIKFANNTNGAEQCQYDSRTGKFYITDPELNGPGDNSAPGGVSVIDPKVAIAVGGGLGSDVQQAVVATYVLPLTACDGPQGMAIGPAPQILIGCNGGPAAAQSNDASVVINDGSTGGTPGSVIAELPNQDGPDMVDYNPSSRLYTLARSTVTPGTPHQVIGMVSATTFIQDISIPTGPGTHSVASSSNTRNTYVPIPTGAASSKLCSSNGGVDTNGCILSLTRSITNTHDFDGNTASDILWRDTNGDVGMWQLSLNTGGFQQQTGKISVQQYSTIGNVAQQWSVVGQRDFAGNGKNAVLWRDTSGDLAQWQMNGAVIDNVASYTPLPSNYSVVGTGQFNANGMGDILVSDNTGDLSIVFMNGTSILAVKPVQKLPTGWVVAGSDNRGAIFLRNMTTGDVGVWLIGCTLSSTTCAPVNTAVFTGVPLTEQIVGIGDFDGNGSSDILWKDTSNNVGMWLMEINSQSIHIKQGTNFGVITGGWSVAATGDFNGTGMADVLWIDTLGNVAAWTMDGTSISSVVNLGNVGTTWQVQSLNSE